MNIQIVFALLIVPVYKAMSVPSLSELCFKVINNTESFILLNGDAIKKLPIEVIQRLLASMVNSIQSRLSKNTIPLKIRLIRQNRLVTFKLRHHAKVSETVQDIFEKTGGGSSGVFALQMTYLFLLYLMNIEFYFLSVTDTVGNYGLFFRGNDKKPSRWLRENKSLSYYDLKPGVSPFSILFLRKGNTRVQNQTESH